MMRTPEELKESLDACFVKQSCTGCHYTEFIDGIRCLATMCKDAMERIGQLEDQIDLMLTQMHGDCGVCKHRHEQAAVFRKAATNGEFAINERCAGCIRKETRPNWEYEGLPEVKSR